MVIMNGEEDLLDNVGVCCLQNLVRSTPTTSSFTRTRRKKIWNSFFSTWTINIVMMFLGPSFNFSLRCLSMRCQQQCTEPQSRATKRSNSLYTRFLEVFVPFEDRVATGAAKAALTFLYKELAPRRICNSFFFTIRSVIAHALCDFQ